MPADQKAELLRKLDGQLTETFDADWKPPVPPDDPVEPEEPAEEPKPVWPDPVWPETDPELLMPFPHDDLYVAYLCAQIDFFNMEMDLYQNDMIVYNNAMSEARAWWRRHHIPWRSRNWRVM